MTPRQKRIIALLGLANVVFLVTVLVLFSRLSRSTSDKESASVAPTTVPQTRFSSACRRRAAQLLSQVELAGTATLADQTLQLNLVYRGGQNAQVEDVAQQVWTAFDVGLALADGQCDTFSRMEIVIRADGASRPSGVYAAVDMADLEAFHGAELSESAFIDRVSYRVEPVDDSGF